MTIPSSRKFAAGLSHPEYIHYMTHDLAGFLAGIGTTVPASTGLVEVPAAG